MTLEQRLDTLERQNRRLKWIGAMVLILSATALFVGARANDYGKMSAARAFVIHDLQGNMRGAFAVNSQGEPGLTLFDKNGKPRAIFSFMDKRDQASIGFQDPQGNIQIVAASKNGGKTKSEAE